jgi:predicted secreted acid phosphatase
LYVSELRKLQKRNEKESGIEFILGQNNKYGDFASVLNDFHIAKARSICH